MESMKHLLLYEGYSASERANDILDKIYKYGIRSITPMEKEFLDAHASGKEDEIHDRMKFKENEVIFEDDSGYFKFEHNKTEDYRDEVHYIGILYVPTMEFESGKKIEGRLEGKIIVYNLGQTSPEFNSIPKNHEHSYDIFEFCNGLEYELDSFIDYVVSELGEKNEEF